jgi:hypothetical protein
MYEVRSSNDRPACRRDDLPRDQGVIISGNEKGGGMLSYSPRPHYVLRSTLYLCFCLVPKFPYPAVELMFLTLSSLLHSSLSTSTEDQSIDPPLPTYVRSISTLSISFGLVWLGLSSIFTAAPETDLDNIEYWQMRFCIVATAYSHGTWSHNYYHVLRI